MGFLNGHLPSTDTVTSSVPAFEIKQKGGGIAGRFEITNPNSAAIALDGVNSGTGHALLAWNLGRGRGAVVITSNSTNTLPALDVSSQSQGTPGTTSAPGLAAAADIRANNTLSTNTAARIATLGLGPVLHVLQRNTVSPAHAFEITSQGTGPLMKFDHRGSAGAFAIYQLAGANKIRLARNGKGFFNGGVQSSGADVAEAFEVEGTTAEYEPGDVLVISASSDRRVERADAAYSTRVIGVYATKPGVLLTEHSIDGDLSAHVPVGIIGVIPTKVTAENGAIRRGDLLVSSSVKGAAMRGTDRELMLGAVIGKALAEYEGTGTGLIPVLVNVK